MPKFRCCFVVEAENLDDLQERFVDYDIDPNFDDLDIEEIVDRGDANVIALSEHR